MKFLDSLSRLRHACDRTECSFLAALARHAYFRARGRDIVTSGGVVIRGLQNIITRGRLAVGLVEVGFMDARDTTFLRIDGSMVVDLPFSIAKGCRVAVAHGAEMRIGGGYVNANTLLSISHGLTIGEGCAISWGCQFLDDDFHTMAYNGRTGVRGERITIGRNVWIGSKVTVLKGAVIPDGCVVAAGSVVTGKFTEPNTLIAGVPARVVRSGIAWGAQAQAAVAA